MKLNQKLFLLSGIFIPIIFWLTLGICGLMLVKYSFLSNIVSELGIIEYPTHLIFTIGLFLCAGLNVIFFIGLYKVCKNEKLNTIPIFIIFICAFSFIGIAAFPMPHRLHGLFGSLSIFLLLSPPLAGILWNKKIKLYNLWLFSVISLVFMALGFLAFFPVILSNYPGLIQRFFHIGWSIWFLYLSWGFINLYDRQSLESTRTSSV
jgi:hypothetical membrane protein